MRETRIVGNLEPERTTKGPMALVSLGRVLKGRDSQDPDVLDSQRGRDAVVGGAGDHDVAVQARRLRRPGQSQIGAVTTETIASWDQSQSAGPAPTIP
jgi:hypothetical protein